MDQIINVCNDLINKEFDSLESSEQRIQYLFDNHIDSVHELSAKVRQFIANHKNLNTKSVVKSLSHRINGNIHFQRHAFECAIYCYNLAVMWAPYPSTCNPESNNELCFAYTCRSLTFYALEEYSDSLHDIECALQLSVSSLTFNQRVELMRHKVICLWQMERPIDAIKCCEAIIQLVPCLPVHNKLVESLIKLRDTLSDRKSDKTNAKTIQSDYELNFILSQCIDIYMSRNLEVYETEDKGRHYKTSESLTKKTIVMVERVISGALFPQYFRTHCQNCFKNIGYKYWPCIQCSQVVFCDEKCYKNAYYHRYECGITDIIAQFGGNHHILYRILLLIGPQSAIALEKQYKSQAEVFEEMDEKSIAYLKFLQLHGHKHGYDLKHKVLTTQRSLQMALILESFIEFNGSSEDFLKDLSVVLDSHYYKVCVNAFAMYEKRCESLAFRGDHIGNAVCFMSSLFNHSCSANCFWVFSGQHITVATSRDIDADEELSICYGAYSQAMGFDERQELLRKRYHFECKCSDCMSEMDATDALGFKSDVSSVDDSDANTLSADFI